MRAQGGVDRHRRRVLVVRRAGMQGKARRRAEVERGREAQAAKLEESAGRRPWGVRRQPRAADGRERHAVVEGDAGV
eukprot:390565-Prymnesium_polylepis.1